MDYVNVKVGTQTSPLPNFEDGRLFLQSDDNFYAEIPTAYKGNDEEVSSKVIGQLWRGLPSRSLLGRFFQELEFRNYNRDKSENGSSNFEQREMAFGAIGNPGIGKTFMYETLGNIQHPKGAILIDCTGLDFNKLFVETVFDTSNINLEKNAIDARIMMLNRGDKQAISSDGVSLLKNMLGEAFIEDADGKISIEWDAINKESSSTYEQEAQAKAFTSLLQQFCDKEGIKITANATSVGFVEKDGPIIRALDPNSADYGRPIILDEINRNPKNMDRLYTLMNFLNSSNRRSTSLQGANGRIVNVNRSELPHTFMINANGNPTTKGMGTTEMSQPFIDRVSFPELPNPTAEDFMDLTCSVVTGVPITIIQETHQIAEEDTQTLSEVCKYYRTLGLSKEQIKAIPQDQMIYLNNIGQFLDVAKCVGKTIFELYELKQKCMDGSACEDQKLRNHIAKSPISPRTISKLFAKAATLLPKKEKVGSFNPLKVAKSQPSGGYTVQDRLVHQGEGLEKAFQLFIKENFCNSEALPELAEPVLGFANNILHENGIGDAQFAEAKESFQSKRLKSMFSFANTKQSSQEALAIQEAMYSILVERYGAKIPHDKDSTIDPFSIESYITEIRENANIVQEIKHPFFGKAITANEDIDTTKNMPFGEHLVFDSFGMVESVSTNDMISQDGFLLSLGINKLGDVNLQTLWPSVSKIMLESNSDVAQEEYIQMMDINSSAYFAVLSLQTAGKKSGQPAFIDIIHNKKDGRTLIVGEETSKKISAVLRSRNITYVDRADEAMSSKIDEWVTDSKLDEDSFTNIKLALKEYHGVQNSNDLHETLMDTASRNRNKVPQMTNITSPIDMELNGKPSQENIFNAIANIKEGR